ncbi:hypothetical protein GWI34_19695 [Actinomadura sp. DSM 109109]|nr:hypothetical protein [Actinomadura lepetitiana]
MRTLLVPLSRNFHLDAGSAETVEVVFGNREDIEVVLAVAGRRFVEAADRATVEEFDEPENSFPLAGKGHRLTVPSVGDGVVARWRRRLSGEGMTITVTIPRDVRFTATIRYGSTVSDRLLDVDALALVALAENPQGLLVEPEMVTGISIRGGCIRLTSRSSQEGL